MKNVPQLTSRGWCLVAASAFLLVGGALSGFTDLIRAGIFTAVLLIVAVVAAAGRTLNLVISRESSSGYRLHCGEETTVHLRLATRTGTRLPVELVDTHTFAPEKKPRWSLPALPQGATHLEYQVCAQLRGKYSAGPSTAWLSEPMGLAQRRVTLGSVDRWLAWPRLVDLDGGSSFLLGEGEEEITAKLASASGYSGAGLREYAPGDDIRHVHWAATARQGELMVRQFDPPARPLTRIILAGDVPGPGIDSDWETLVSLAASAIDHLQRRTVPTELVLDQEHFTSRATSLDALAAVGRCASPVPPEHNAPSLLFHHSSAQPTLLAPIGVRAIALVLGDASDSVISNLTALGWETVRAEHAEDGGSCLTAILREFEGGR